MRIVNIIVLCLLSAPVMALNVFIDGNVALKGNRVLTEGSRINDALEVAQVNENTFFIGASWQRQSEKSRQLRLKEGILFDLSILQQQAHLDNQPALAATALNLEKQVRAMPVTGRIKHPMDPSALPGTRINHLLEDGDRLVFPSRPSNILVLGAAERNCIIAFSTMKKANDYLEICPHREQADRNYIVVIQPDGAIFREGIALWNKSTFTFIAPGSIIFLPFSETIHSNITKELNQEIAEFLATQTPAMANAP